MKSTPSITTHRALVSTSQVPHQREVSLLDVLDRVVDTGVVVDGELFLQVAEIDLINVSLKLVLSSTERLRGAQRTASRKELERQKLELKELQRDLERAQKLVPAKMSFESPQKAEHGLAKLVLTLVELIRKLMERQAMRRIQGESLSEIEIERLGLTFKALEKKMNELKDVFGIKDHELNLELGPIGNLM